MHRASPLTNPLLCSFTFRKMSLPYTVITYFGDSLLFVCRVSLPPQDCKLREGKNLIHFVWSSIISTHTWHVADSPCFEFFKALSYLLHLLFFKTMCEVGCHYLTHETAEAQRGCSMSRSPYFYFKLLPLIKKIMLQEFPGDPVVKIQALTAEGPVSVPGQGTKIL